YRFRTLIFKGRSTPKEIAKCGAPCWLVYFVLRRSFGNLPAIWHRTYQFALTPVPVDAHPVATTTEMPSTTVSSAARVIRSRRCRNKDLFSALAPAIRVLLQTANVMLRGVETSPECECQRGHSCS